MIRPRRPCSIVWGSAGRAARPSVDANASARTYELITSLTARGETIASGRLAVAGSPRDQSAVENNIPPNAN